MPTWRASSRSGAIRVASEGVELVTNGDMEAAAATFDEDSDTQCSYTQDAAQHHAGSNSAKVVRTTAGSDEFDHIYTDTDNSVVTNGTLYKCTMYLYNPTTGGVPNVYAWTDINGVSKIAGNIVARDRWVRTSIQALAVTGHFHFGAYGNSTQNSFFYIDDVSIKALTLGLG